MAQILVVDDEADIVRIVKKIMEACGHTVRTAGDGLLALKEVAENRPDIIILDLNLPKMDGFEVCRRLKGDPATQAIPVLMMTAAYVTVEDARKGEQVGADEYIIKPFLRDILVHNVTRLLHPTA
jgi:CheY-like chemotaxis protein